MEDFPNFLDDIGKGQKRFSIERIDVNGITIRQIASGLAKIGRRQIGEILFTEDGVREIRELIKAGISKDICLKFGFSSSLINQVLSEKAQGWVV